MIYIICTFSIACSAGLIDDIPMIIGHTSEEGVLYGYAIFETPMRKVCFVVVLVECSGLVCVEKDCIVLGKVLLAFITLYFEKNCFYLSPFILSLQSRFEYSFLVIVHITFINRVALQNQSMLALSACHARCNL